MIRVVVLLLIFVVSGCFEAESPEEATSFDRTDYKPKLYSFDHNGTTSYIFGSIHSGTAEMYPLPDYVLDAFAASTILALEIDISKEDPENYSEMITSLGNSENRPLKTYLSPETLSELEATCDPNGFPCESEYLQEPWFAAFGIERRLQGKSGVKPKYGIDRYFSDNARGKPIIALENVGEQLALLDSAPIEAQEILIRSAVSRPRNFFSIQVKAWMTGNLKEFAFKDRSRLLSLGIDKSNLDTLDEYLLVRRNKAMAQKILESAELNESLFVVVGAAHLELTDSVLDQLRSHGIKITEVSQSIK